MKDTFSSTNSLRGFSILAVLVNHYINLNITGDNRGFAILWVALFFIVSGYGISFSLNCHFKDCSYTFRTIFSFYYKRAIRILPLFFIALVVESLVRSNGSTMFMIPGIHYSGHYWFVLSILQCYMVAPVIYLCIQKSRIVTVCGSLFLFIVLTYLFYENIFPSSLVKVLKVLHSDYRNIFFLNILIFSLSMCLPAYIENWQDVSISEKKILLCLVVLFIMLGMTSAVYADKIQYVYMVMNSSLYPLVLIFIMSIYVISNLISFKVFSFLGEISYSIYLFHKSLYLSIDKNFGYGMNSWSELSIYVVFVLLFFFVCIYIEKAGKKMTLFLKI